MAKSKSEKSTSLSTAKTPTKTDADIDGKKAGRDARIDEIGFAEELYDQYVEDLRTAVKTAGISRGLDRITGDFFTGTLAGGNAGSAIDPAKFFKLCEKKKIPRKNQIAAVAIGIKAAAQILSQDEIDSISFETAARAKSLTVKRNDGVHPTLIEALERVSADIKQKTAPTDPMPNAGGATETPPASSRADGAACGNGCENCPCEPTA